MPIRSQFDTHEQFLEALRDWFASQALGRLVSGDSGPQLETWDAIAAASYDAADAMLRMRDDAGAPRVFVLEAAHYDVPGRVRKVYATRARADAGAAGLVNLLRADLGLTPDADADNWQGRLEEARTAVEGRGLSPDALYVEIDEMSVIAS